jgi:hypothetical protein
MNILITMNVVIIAKLGRSDPIYTLSGRALLGNSLAANQDPSLESIHFRFSFSLQQLTFIF